MQKKITSAVVCLVLLMAVQSYTLAQSRVLRQAQQRLEQRLLDEVLPEKESKDEKGRTHDASRDTNRSSPQNTMGGGLDADIPDVKSNIADAKSALSSGSYRMAKDATRRAMWAVEIEMGRALLKSLPTSVDGLPFIESYDKVSNTAIGYTGLLIERVYQKDNKELRILVANDSSLLHMAGWALASHMYMEDSSQPNSKQIHFQEHRAVIAYDDREGYSLSVPFGQSSILLLGGVNFANETQFMNAAQTFKMKQIKNQLGE